MNKAHVDLAADIKNFLMTTEGYVCVENSFFPKDTPFFLGLKRKCVTLMTVNNRSLFQPYENKTTKDIVMAFVVTLGNPSPPYADYIAFGCPWVAPQSMEEFEAFCKTL